MFEALQVQVTSLLGCLVLESSVVEYFFSVFLLQSLLDIQYLVLVLFFVQTFYSGFSATRSILSVFGVCRIKADEVEDLRWVFYAGASVDGGDVSVSTTQS